MSVLAGNDFPAFPDNPTIPIDLEIIPNATDFGRYKHFALKVREWELTHSLEYLSLLELKELLRRVPDGTVVRIDL